MYALAYNKFGLRMFHFLAELEVNPLRPVFNLYAPETPIGFLFVINDKLVLDRLVTMSIERYRLPFDVMMNNEHVITEYMNGKICLPLRYEACYLEIVTITGIRAVPRTNPV